MAGPAVADRSATRRPSEPMGFHRPGGGPTASFPTVAVVGPSDDVRRIEPTGKAPWWYFGDITLATHRQFAEQFGLAAVAFVERHPIKAVPVADGAVIELQGNLPLGPISHSVGNPRFSTAVATGSSASGEVQITVEDAVEILTCEAQVDGNNAVLGLAQPTTPLLLDAGRLVTLFRVAGFVEGPNDMGTLMVSGDELMEPFSQAILIPAVLAEKFLQGARRDIRVECNRLHALFREVRKLASNRTRPSARECPCTWRASAPADESGRHPCLAFPRSLARHSFVSNRNYGKIKLVL